MPNSHQVVVIGAGASGLFCAAQAAKLGCQVTVIDNGKKVGRKILMSGGGRCNFTNLYADHHAYISHNPHFCKSALARYTQWDFLELVQRYNIAYHQREHGQLFCDNSAQDIVDLLVAECTRYGVEFKLRTQLLSVDRLLVNDLTDSQQATLNPASRDGFLLTLSSGDIRSQSLVVATGGLSLPGLGATSIGYRLAEQFNLPVIPVRAGLVPFTLHKELLDTLQTLSGIALPVLMTTEHGVSFKENLLFTHRGLSGPVVLQISNYWQPGEWVTINLLPEHDIDSFIDSERENHPNQSVKNTLAKLLPKRLVECLQSLTIVPDLTLKQLNKSQQQPLVDSLQHWKVQPNGTEGYRTAEVTLGGIDTRCLSSKTMQVNQIAGLYFIGEVVDVTGWLGGYNFQWAWSSGWACAQALAK